MCVVDHSGNTTRSRQPINGLVARERSVGRFRDSRLVIVPGPGFVAVFFFAGVFLATVFFFAGFFLSTDFFFAGFFLVAAFFDFSDRLPVPRRPFVDPVVGTATFYVGRVPNAGQNQHSRPG